MSRHPYQELEGHAAWRVVNRAIDKLVANGDIQESTAREYIVGYLLESLEKAGQLAHRPATVNGARRRLAGVKAHHSAGSVTANRPGS